MLKFSRGIILFAGVVLLLAIGAQAQARVAPGAKLFIAPMEGDLHDVLAAEIVKKKLPVSVVTDEQAADFIVTGKVTKSDDKWYNSALGGKDSEKSSIRLVSVKDKQIVWVGEAGDRGVLWGSLSKSGQNKMAQRLVEKMKKDLFD